MQRRHRPLTDLEKMESGKTIAISNPTLATRLTAMGVLPGATVQMVRKAPFGKAYYIKVEGIRLALRQDEAESILLEI